jgi:hypothetical protein
VVNALQGGFHLFFGITIKKEKDGCDRDLKLETMPSHSQSEEMFLLSANEIFFLIKKRR